jgi:hypothetical protein
MSAFDAEKLIESDSIPDAMSYIWKSYADQAMENDYEDIVDFFLENS